MNDSEGPPGQPEQDGRGRQRVYFVAGPDGRRGVGRDEQSGGRMGSSGTVNCEACKVDPWATMGHASGCERGELIARYLAAETERMEDDLLNGSSSGPYGGILSSIPPPPPPAPGPKLPLAPFWS